jgi:hypothetical protein
VWVCYHHHDGLILRFVDICVTFFQNLAALWAHPLAPFFISAAATAVAINGGG